MFVLFFLMAFSFSASATCGTTEYSGSAGRLYDMTVYVTTMCTLTLELLCAIAVILGMYSATSIYIKLQAGDDGLTKSVMILVGSCLFMLAAFIVLPSFFGFSFG